MKLQHHIAISAVFSCAVGGAAHSWPLAISSFLAGVFIDLDHFFDYWMEHGPRFHIPHFFDTCHERQYKRVVLFLHGWEWIIVLAVASLLTRWNPWVTGVFLGLGQHLVADFLANGTSTFAYFITCRGIHRFDIDYVFPPEKFHVASQSDEINPR